MNQKVSGEERLAAICQALRQETLSPAQHEAEAIILSAKREAERLLDHAKKEIDELKQTAKKEIEKEKLLFHSSMKHATHQIVDSLKEELENLLFKKGIDELLQEELSSTEQTATLLSAMIQMVQKEGLSSSPEIWIGKNVDKKALLSFLTKQATKQPSSEKISVGSFSYGFTLLIKDKHMTLEVTEDSVREILASILKREYRKYLFKDQEDGVEKTHHE